MKAKGKTAEQAASRLLKNAKVRAYLEAKVCPSVQPPHSLSGSGEKRAMRKRHGKKYPASVSKDIDIPKPLSGRVKLKIEIELVQPDADVNLPPLPNGGKGKTIEEREPSGGK